MALDSQPDFDDFDEIPDHFFDQYPALMLLESVAADVFELYQPFLLRVPSGGKILDAGIAAGRDSWYFENHGYEVISARLRSVQREQLDWDAEFDGIWAFQSLEEEPQEFVDSILENMCRAMKPTGVMLACVHRWGADWETSPERPGCNAVNLLRLVRKHPCFLLDAIWESRCGLNVMLMKR